MVLAFHSVPPPSDAISIWIWYWDKAYAFIATAATTAATPTERQMQQWRATVNWQHARQMAGAHAMEQILSEQSPEPQKLFVYDLLVFLI